VPTHESHLGGPAEPPPVTDTGRAAGAAAALTRPLLRAAMSCSFTLPVRYAREVTDLNVPCREENFTLGHRQWTLPRAQCALVLVDCWSEHVVVSHLQRGSRIAEQSILPVLRTFRALNMAVLHAPAPQTAAKYPEFFCNREEMPPRAEAAEAWPPPAFRKRVDQYVGFARVEEPHHKKWVHQHSHKRRIIPCLAPEANDIVVANGQQLHRVCEAQQLLHLFYAGFATNICVEHRDYVRESSACCVTVWLCER
jgi:hypothetical protein